MGEVLKISSSKLAFLALFSFGLNYAGVHLKPLDLIVDQDDTI